MGENLRSWWQQIKTHPVISVLIVLAIALVVLVILGGYLFHWDWAGFNGKIKSGKTLWDWLQLLFIPVVLAIAGFWFNHRERKAAELLAENEHDIAEDDQREAALQTYIQEISELLLHENLRKSMPEDEVRTIARVRTLTVLPRLDSGRKRSLLQFLYESGLIEKDKSVIDLQGADLSEANLIRAYLPGVGLRGANLQEADLRGANLQGADLRNVYLSGAMLNVVDLREADLSHAQLGPTNLFGANLFGATLNVTDLFEVHFDPACLRAARLKGANLSGTQLAKVILRDAQLIGADLRNAYLYGADLSEADLSGTTLSGADLRGAYLIKAYLQADLSEADLSDAYLNLADLRGSIVTTEQLDQVRSLKGATMPDGSIHP